MAIRPTTPEFVIPGKGKTGNDSEKDNGLVSPAFKKQENDPEVQRALAAARAAELKAKIEASQDKKAKVSKVKQLIGLFRAYAPKSERKLKDEVVDQVSDIARRVDQADDETLSRYEQTVKEKLQLVENDQVAEILEEVAELDKLEQARPELTRLDNLSSSKKKMVSELSDGSEKKSREVEKSMVAAANLLQEKTKDIPESKTIVEAIKDTMVSIRVELGKKFQGWSENEVKAYLARAYKGDITKIEAKLAQIMPEDSEIRAEEIEREVKKAEEQEPVVALKVKEVLAPKSEADLADQMKEVGREALNALVESYQPTDEDTHQTRTAIAKQKVSYRFNRALNFDPAVNGVSEYVISDEQIDAMVDDAYSETGLDPEKISTRSLTKKKTEFEIGATKNALKRRMSALNKQREVYLEGAFEASDELEHIKPQIPPASEDEEGTIYANLEKFHTLDIEQQRTIEAAGTMRLRNYLIEQGLNKKRQLLEGGEYAHTVDEVMDELRGASLDDITVEFTDEGIAVLRFTNIEDLAKFDQTIDKNGKLVYQNYQYDHETYENPDNQQFVLGTAFVQEGFFATHVDGDAILDEHEQAHLKKEYDRQIRLDYIENRTRESIAEYLIERSADSDFNFGDDLEKLSDHIGFVLKQEDMENARGWGFDVDMLKQINQLVEKGEAGELEGDEAKMYRYFNRMKSVAEAMATEASQKAHSEELGTSLMTLPMYNETSLTLASAGIFKDGEKKYDTSKETHLASLALVRYLNTLADNNRELFVEKQLAIAGLVLRKDKLTLHDVASIIQEIETNELFAGLAPERTENFGEEAQKYVNADIDDTVKMQAFFDAYGLENHPGNISLTSEEFNLLYRLFILEGKVPSFEPTELEVTEEQIHEFDETPNFSHHSFMRQYFQDPKHGIFSRDLHRPTLFPILVTRGAPWPLRSFDIPGTGDKGFATIAHFLPQGLRNFMYFGNEGLEKIDPDKIIPFGLADNPRLEGVVEWLKGFNKYEDPAHLRQLGAFERYVLNIQTTRGTIINTLNVTNNQADLALTKIGGIEVDWYKGQQTFRLEDLNQVDEYRSNRSLDMFVKSAHTRPNVLATELGKVNEANTITVAGSATPLPWPPAGSSEKITKGTITDGLMDEILGTMYVTEINAGSSAKERSARDKEESKRESVYNVGKAVMQADHDAFNADGSRFTMLELIKEIKRVDNIGPTTPEYLSGANRREFVMIGTQKVKIEDARVFVQQFYMGRAHRVLHTGMYHGEKISFKKEADGTVKYRLNQDARTGVLIDPFTGQVHPRGGTPPPPLWVNLPNTITTPGGPVPDDYVHPFVDGELVAGEEKELLIYKDDDISIENNVTGHKTNINPLMALDEGESFDMFGEKIAFTATGSSTSPAGFAVKEGVLKGIPYLTRDAMDDRQMGIDLYWEFLKRYYQAEQVQKVADLQEKMWGFWDHIDKVARWSMVAIALVSIMNPALFGVVSLNYLLGVAAYSHTVSPFISKSAKNWGAKKKAAEAAFGSLFSKHNMFFEASQKQLSTTEYKLLQTFIKSLKGEVKGIAKAASENFTWGGANKTQGLVGDIFSGTGAMFA